MECSGVIRPATAADVRRRFFDLADATPNCDWLIVTERPENIERMMPWARRGETRMEPAQRKNIWLIVRIRTQAEADERIPHLLKVPAAVRGVWVEPGEGIRLDQCAPHTMDDDESNPAIVNAFNGLCYHPRTVTVKPNQAGTVDGIGLVVVSGQTGRNARPLHPDHVRGLRDQCAAAAVPFHFLSWGEWEPEEHAWSCSADGETIAAEQAASRRKYETEQAMRRVGSRAAGRLLDGREWTELPEVGR
jgi:protein gp37